ncbi:MAG TPA: trypsin-like peptidase domain-containing protein [Phycisphaerae bacterium]|nr:trypsin-like peptidase domain-containing protein [Phycisphaerae bacterium]
MRLTRSSAAVIAAAVLWWSGPTWAAPASGPPSDAAKAVEVAIERAADQVSPAVVNVSVVRETTAGPWGQDVPEGDLDSLPEEWRRLLERYRRHPPIPFRAQGNGSGFIISADGFILTSEHVVRDAVEIQVTLSTRKRYRAKVVGADPRRDLAVIRIDAKGLPVVRLGDAGRLRRGQFVLALGSPFGFGRDGQASLSFGIVSGTDRVIPNIGRELDRYYGNLIQTDAAVNPGNSGGPLVNLDGEVVGVNAVISSQTGASDGVGFAVPITAGTKAIIARLKRGEKVIYGFVGIEIQEVAEEQAKATGAEVGEGAYVVRVLPDAPGAKAGIKTGDVVVAIDDAAVRSPDDVIQIVQATPVGEKVSLVVLRDGKRQSVAVEVAQRPSPTEVAAVRSGDHWWRGMRVEPLTEELKEQIGLEKDESGVFVREVLDDSAAAKAGVMPGMVIDQVGETRIASLQAFRDATRSLKGKGLVHVAGIGVKVIPGPDETKPDAKQPPEKGDVKPDAKTEPKKDEKKEDAAPAPPPPTK